MKITIAILCSSDESIKACLDSIKRDIEILVVVNKPSLQVLNIIQADKRIRILYHDYRNLGKMRQMAAENTRTEGILYIDSDCVFDSNTIELVQNELDIHKALSIPMRYKYNSFFSKITSKCRLFTTPDTALYIPCAFQLDIQEQIGGYLYDERLEWGEDSDQRQRLDHAEITFAVSDGVIFHKSQSLREDAMSALRIGEGRWIQYKNRTSPKRSIIKDLYFPREIVRSYQCARAVGILPAIYHFLVWRPCYKIGYWKNYFKYEY